MSQSRTVVRASETTRFVPPGVSAPKLGDLLHEAAVGFLLMSQIPEVVPAHEGLLFPEVVLCILSKAPEDPANDRCPFALLHGSVQFVEDGEKALVLLVHTENGDRKLIAPLDERPAIVLGADGTVEVGAAPVQRESLHHVPQTIGEAGQLEGARLDLLAP